MGATTVTATILGVDNQPIVGAYTYFRLKSVGTDSVATTTIDRDRRTLQFLQNPRAIK